MMHKTGRGIGMVEFTDGYEMTHKAKKKKAWKKVPIFSRPLVQFQGHMGKQGH